MYENELEELLDVLITGDNLAEIEDVSQLQEIIEQQGIEALFPLIPPGYVEDAQELADAFPSLKKKDFTNQNPDGSQFDSSNTASTSKPGQEGSPSAAGTSTLETAEDFIQAYDPEFIPERITGARYGSNYQVGEKDTWLERTLGKNFITDFFGDIYRAGAGGLKQGATLDDALALFKQGADVDEETLQEYLRVVREADQVGVSDEMREYNRIYEEAGKGPWGVIKGLFMTRGQIVPQVLVSSIASMLNPTAAAGAGAGAAATGAAAAGVGAVAGSIGTPIGSAIAGAVTGTAGAIAGTFGGASAILETGLTFTELLKEEVQKLGLEFDEEGVLEALSTPGVLQSLRNRSVGRGLTIGIIDGIARGTVGQLVLKPAKNIAKAGKMLTRAQKANNALKAAGIEGLGGSLGETLGRVVAGQEMDASEIALEGIVGNTSALVTVPQAVTGKTVVELVGGEKAQAKVDKATAVVNKKVKSARGKVYDFTIGKKGLNVFKLPVYGVKNKAGTVTPMTKEEILNMVTTMDLNDIRTAQFEIKNDPQLEQFVQDQKQAAQIGLDLPDFVQGENRAQMIELEMELRNMQDPDLKANKIRIKEINAELDALTEKSRVDSQKTTQKTKERLQDSQIPISQQKFTVDMDGEIINATISTNLDGSRRVRLMDKDGTAFTDEVISKDNTLSNEEYLTAAAGEVNTTEDVDIETVRNPKVLERMSNRQREAAGLPPKEVKQSTAEVRKLAVDELKADGIIEPTEQQINEKADAIQKSSATQVDVQESTQDSQAVGEGDAVGVTTPEGQAQSQSVELTPEAQAQEKVAVDDLVDQAADLDISVDASQTPQEVLTSLRSELIATEKEGTNLFRKVTNQINLAAKNRGVTPNEFIKPPAAEAEVTADENRVRNIAREIKQKIESRRPKKMNPATRKKQIFDAVIEYASQTKLAEQLNDVQFDQLIRDLTTEFGLKSPTRASVTKAFKLAQKNNPRLAAIDQQAQTKPTDKKIVVNERVALKDQIKLEAKAARESVKAYQKFLSTITAKVKSLRKAKKISSTQSNAILDRLPKLRYNNDKAVDSYLKYVDRVFTKAATLEKLQRAKVKAKKAKTQVGGKKTGAIPNASKVILKNLFSISPFAIPDSKIDAYIDLVDQFGTAKTQVKLTNTLKENVSIAEDILNEAYKDAEADIQAAPQMSEQKDYNLSKAVKEIKDDVIRDKEINQLQDEAQKQDARDLQKLTSQDIKDLVETKKDGTKDYSLVEKLRTGIEQIKNGILVKDVTDILTEVDKNKRLRTLENLKKKNGKKVFANAKKDNILSRMANYGSTIKQALKKKGNYLLDKIESQSTFFIDDVLGNFNSKAIYNNTVGAIGRAYSKYNTETNLEYKKIDEADAMLEADVGTVRRKLGITKRKNKVVESKIKAQLFMLEREHLGNIVDGKPNSLAESGYKFFKATIDNKNVLDPATKKIARKILSDYSTDGKVDFQKLENSLTRAEKRYINQISDVNKSLANKAVYISGSLHGNQINLLNDYTHHAVLDVDGKQSDLLRKQNRFTELPSTKSNTIVERTPGAKPISLDPSYSARRGVQETNLDYYMTREVRTVRKTINSLKKKMKETDNQTAVDVVEALDDAVKNRLQTVFQKSFSDMTILDKIGGPVARLGYYQTLASAPRTLVEMGTNLIMAIKNPKLALNAFGNYAGITLTNPNRIEIGLNFMNKANSSLAQKLYNIDELGGKMADLNEFIRPDQDNASARNEVADKALQILKYTGLKQTAKSIDKLSARLLSYGDQAITRPMWFGAFNQAFVKAVKSINKESIADLTPKEIELFSQGKSKYNNPKYKAAVAIATKAADTYGTTIASSTNPFDAIGKNLIKPSDGVLQRVYKQANRFMLRFQLFEFGTAKHAVNALYKSGDLSKKEAAGLLTAVTMRMTMYMVGYTALTQLMDEELFGIEDDGSEEDFASLLARQMIGSMLSLGVRRNLGNIPALPVNFLLEHGLNEPYLGDLRNDEEYDPYKHALIFNQLGKADLKDSYGLNLKTLLRVFAGPYGPVSKTLLRTGELASRATFGKEESKKRAEEELTNRMTIEVMGNLGLLPFYKDIRRIILKDMYGKKPPTKEEIKRRVEQEQRSKEALKDLGIDLEIDDLDLDMGLDDLDLDLDFDL